MNLQLQLKTNWFEMTKEKIKKEDYRDITPYWCNRLLLQDGETQTKDFWSNYLEIYGSEILKTVLSNYDNIHRIKAKEFSKNIMTKGYPKKSDLDKILTIKHKGIEIRTGNPDWGAEPNKLCFVIKHGMFLNEA